MKYFYEVTAVSGKNSEIKFFIASDVPYVEGKATPLTVEMLTQNPSYMRFADANKNKAIHVNYVMHSTNDDIANIDPGRLDEHFRSLIDNGNAEKCSSSSLMIEPKKSTKAAPRKGGKKRRTSKKFFYAVIAVSTLTALLLGIGIGGVIGNGRGNQGVDAEQEIIIDGMIMPKKVEFSPDAQLLTVSIDRSHLAVPREDVQLQGEVIDGVAVIKLPRFDRTNFFDHVTGHTWGFTSEPQGTKIEFYGGMEYRFSENVKLYRVLVKYGGGSGTREDPYMIDYYDQLNLMAENQVRGFFRQTADITFPEWTEHTPIDTVNELKRTPEKEHFEYDGGEFKIEGLTAPLFGRVSGSLIHNVNVTNAFIETEEHMNLGFIVNEAYNFQYDVDGTVYETGETIIRNCTVHYSAITVKLPELDDGEEPPLDYDEDESGEESTISGEVGEVADDKPPPTKTAEYALGGITGLGGQIENCYVTDVGLFAESPSIFLYAGGVSGKPANVVNSGVYFLAIKGNIFHAGGIAGSAAGSRLRNADGAEVAKAYGGNVQGCYVRSFTAHTENSAGGIVGEASTDAENAMISNSYATDIDLRIGIFADKERTTALKLGTSGGVVGSDGNDSNGHIIVNTVSPVGLGVIGAERVSAFDDTVRLAPQHAFTQSGMLEVVNRNAVHPNVPGVIFTGTFMFAEDARNSNDTGAFPFPEGISESLLRIHGGGQDG